MAQVHIESIPTTLGERSFEIVERKGIGHPDTICDSVMEAGARALARRYLDVFGAPQHFNLDKGLLAAGHTTPRFGGGAIEAPMRLVFGDRAVYESGGKSVPVESLLVEAARRWFREHLRFVDPESGLVFQNEVRAGSPQLTALFATGSPPANDTSAATGFAPLTPTERVVLATERFLNDPDTKARFPEVGEDIKVMAVRRYRTLSLTVAAAFVDRFIDSEKTYFRRKRDLHQALAAFVDERLGNLGGLETFEIAINTLDAPGGGSDSVYLTVTGTSAEGGDSGQVGRGNRLGGLFSARRPGSNEAVAGKNPQSHVGKIYNVLAQRMAERIAVIDGVREASVHLVSQIGHPLQDPHLAAVELALARGVEVGDVAATVEAAIETELQSSAGFAEDWIAGRNESD